MEEPGLRRPAGPRRSAVGQARSRARSVAVALVLGLSAAGCGGGGYTPAGPFRPLPQGQPPEVAPQEPQGRQAAPPAPGRPTDPESGGTAGDPAVVASGLAVPTGLAVLPDGSALVGERSTGRLLQVFPDRSPARELMTVPGIDPAGDGGLLGLAVSPTYAEDRLVYAYVSSGGDNRVVRFPLGGTPNTVLAGIPHAAAHNGGALLAAPDGTLFVGTGDTGVPALAQDPASLAGKVLHVDVFGRPVSSGPGNAGPVVSQGHSNVTALCQGEDRKIYATDVATDVATDGPAAGGRDELNQIQPGADYGWPTRRPASVEPVSTFPPGQGGLGGCALAGKAVFLGSLDGQRIDIVALDARGKATGEAKDVLTRRYGRLRTVVLDPSGGLWITTSNRDGHGTPGPDDDKVLRIVPPTSSGNSSL